MASESFIKNIGSLQEFIDLPLSQEMNVDKKIPISTRIFCDRVKNKTAKNIQQHPIKRQRQATSQFQSLQQSQSQIQALPSPKFKPNQSNNQQKQSSITKKRVKTTLQDYSPSKKYIHPSHQHNLCSPRTNHSNIEQDYQHLLKKKMQLNSSININNPSHHSKNLSYRGAILPRRDHILQFFKKRRPKPQETLLRAIDRLQKKDTIQVQQIELHDQSLDILKNKLSNSDNQHIINDIKLYQPKNHKQINNHDQLQQHKHRKSQSTHTNIPSISSSMIIQKNKMIRKISSQKRIQFQQCLSWAKKHHKNCSYYERSLGKIKNTEKLEDTYRKRQKIMKQLYHKQNSFHHHDNNSNNKQKIHRLSSENSYEISRRLSTRKLETNRELEIKKKRQTQF